MSRKRPSEVCYEKEAPDRLEEFFLVFDPTYQSLEERIGPASKEASSVGGLGFEGEVVLGTMISTAVWVALSFTKAAIRDSVERDLPNIMDHIEGKLTEHTGKRRLVKHLRQRVEGILKQM